MRIYRSGGSVKSFVCSWSFRGKHGLDLEMALIFIKGSVQGINRPLAHISVYLCQAKPRWWLKTKPDGL